MATAVPINKHIREVLVEWRLVTGDHSQGMVTEYQLFAYHYARKDPISSVEFPSSDLEETDNAGTGVGKWQLWLAGRLLDLGFLE